MRRTPPGVVNSWRKTSAPTASSDWRARAARNKPKLSGSLILAAAIALSAGAPDRPPDRPLDSGAWVPASTSAAARAGSGSKATVRAGSTWAAAWRA